MTGGRRLPNERGSLVPRCQRNRMRYLGYVARCSCSVGSDRRPLGYRWPVSRSGRTLMSGRLVCSSCSLVYDTLVSRRGLLVNGLLMGRCSLGSGMLLRSCSLIRSLLPCDGRFGWGRSTHLRWGSPPHRLSLWPLLTWRRPPCRLRFWRLLAGLRPWSLLTRLPCRRRLALARRRGLSPRRWRLGMLLFVILRLCANCESKYDDEC